MAIRIHHTQKAQAQKLGVILTAEGDLVKATWPEYNQEVMGKTASAALESMREIMETVRNAAANDEEDLPEDNEPEQPESDGIERNAAGIPLDGGQAHKEGFTASDCPYTSETDDEEEYAEYERWNTEFDEHADEEEEDKGSVVAEKYRAKYAEMGHPTHCGDDLATLLNNLCQTKNETDLGRFEAICNANGVDLSKYNRTTNGWQGRLRMTGRNLLARKVYEAGGLLHTPIEGADPEGYKMSDEWMATRRYSKEA
jgi:hypothetical protein